MLLSKETIRDRQKPKAIYAQEVLHYILKTYTLQVLHIDVIMQNELLLSVMRLMLFIHCTMMKL